MTNKSFLVRSVRIAVVWIPAFVARTDGYTYTKTSEQETWDCVDASMKALNSRDPKFEENFNALFNNTDDFEFQKWKACQRDLVYATTPGDATCSYDYQTDPKFQSVIVECQNAGGDMYVADYVIECEKPEYSMEIVTQNDPYCIVPELTECESINNLIITPEIPFENGYHESGYSCDFIKTELHVFKEEVTVPNDDSNLPMIIGVAAAAVAAVIGGGVFVRYVRRRRNQQKSDQNLKGATLQQGDTQEEHIDAITQAVQSAATNAVRQAVLEFKSIPADSAYGSVQPIDVPVADVSSFCDMASAPVATASVLECIPITTVKKGKIDKCFVEV